MTRHLKPTTDYPIVSRALSCRFPLPSGGRPAGCDGCARLADPAQNRATLIDGTVVCTWCEAWRAECAHFGVVAAAVVKLPDRAARRAAVDALRAHFGDAYGSRMESSVRDAWAARVARVTSSTASPEPSHV